MIGAGRRFARGAEQVRSETHKVVSAGAQGQRCTARPRGVTGPLTRKETASGVDLRRGGESLGAANARAFCSGWTRVGKFRAGTRRVRRFVPRGSVRELRVRGGRIRMPEGPRRGIHERIAHVSARRWTTRCTPSPARSDLTGPAQSSAIGAAQRLCTAQTGKRRAFSGERFAGRGLHNAAALRGKRFACRRFRRIAPRLSGQETGGSAQHRATFRTLPRKGGPARRLS